MIPQDCRIFFYGDLVATLARRRHDLRFSQLEVDQNSGLQDGYTGKVESWNAPSSRKLGHVSMPNLLAALRVSIVLVSDTGEILPRISARNFNREALRVLWPNPNVPLGTVPEAKPKVSRNTMPLKRSSNGR